MRSILNFTHHRKNGNTDVLADWNKYLLFQDFLKCSEHFLSILVAFHSIAKYRDLKELLQTGFPWSDSRQQAITERTQIEQISQQAAGVGGRGEEWEGEGILASPSVQAFQLAELVFGFVLQGN